MIVRALSLLVLATLPFMSFADSYLERPEVKQFIDRVAKKHNLQKDQLNSLFAKVDKNERVIELISKPAESFNWDRYRRIFISDKRVNLGVKFWKKHKELLSKASKKYGVPEEIIVGIIGVETYYGQNKGGFLVLESLSTLAFDYPKRSKFFTKELEHYLLLTKENDLDPLKLEGSYAGAIGIAQFMPSSYRHYAKSFEANQNIDLVNKPADAIASVGNYLKTFGFSSSDFVAQKAITKGDSYKKLAARSSNPKPKYSKAKLERNGISINSRQKLGTKDKLAVIVLEKDKGEEVWLANENFYAITRYNHSSNYAMAVFQLASLIKDKMPKG